MNLLFTRGSKTFIRNLVILLVVFNVTLLSLAPKAFAQTQPTTPSQPIQQQSPQTAPPDPYIVPTPGGTETGRVLQCGPLGSIPGCDAIVGGVLGGIGNIGEAIWNFMSGKLVELLLKIITTVFHIVASVMGSAISAAGLADSCPTDKTAQCQAMMEQMAKVDPLLSPEYSTTISSFNIFTLADDSYSTLYTSFPDTNFIDETTYLARETLLGTTPVLAQETEGTNDLGELIRGLWGKMRDISYIASVIALVIIGFMVMLRRRLDPKTVVTATNSLPRVAIGLVLITFSFAISSLFVDMIHLLVELTKNYLGNLPGLTGLLSSMSDKFGGEFLWLPFFTLISESVISWQAFLTLMGLALGGALATSGLSLLLVAIPLLAALLFDIIIRLGMFILAMMLFWSLLTRYATLVILTVFSPFFFLAGMIPGFEGVTITWFKRMLASVLAFPAILVIAYLALALLSPNLGSGIGAPPPLGTASSILNISALVGLGVLYFAHKVPGVIDDVLGIKDTKQKGPSPLVLLAGGAAGLQTLSTVSKAAPAFRGFLSAAGSGPMGTVRGGVYKALSVLSGNPVSQKDWQQMQRERAANPAPARGQSRSTSLAPQRAGSAASAPTNPVTINPATGGLTRAFYDDDNDQINQNPSFTNPNPAQPPKQTPTGGQNPLNRLRRNNNPTPAPEPDDNDPNNNNSNFNP